MLCRFRYNDLNGLLDTPPFLRLLLEWLNLHCTVLDLSYNLVLWAPKMTSNDPGLTVTPNIWTKMWYFHSYNVFSTLILPVKVKFRKCHFVCTGHGPLFLTGSKRYMGSINTMLPPAHTNVFQKKKKLADIPWLKTYSYTKNNDTLLVVYPICRYSAGETPLFCLTPRTSCASTRALSTPYFSRNSPPVPSILAANHSTWHATWQWH